MQRIDTQISTAVFYSRQNVSVLSENNARLPLVKNPALWSPWSWLWLCFRLREAAWGCVLSLSGVTQVSRWAIIPTLSTSYYNKPPFIHILLHFTIFRALLTSVGVLSKLPSHDSSCPQCLAYLQTVQELIQDISLHNHQNNFKVYKGYFTIHNVNMRIMRTIQWEGRSYVLQIWTL